MRPHPRPKSSACRATMLSVRRRRPACRLLRQQRSEARLRQPASQQRSWPPRTPHPWPRHSHARPCQCASWDANARIRACPRPPTSPRHRRLRALGQSASHWRESRRGCAQSRSASCRLPTGGAWRASAWQCRQSAGRWWVRQTRTARLFWRWLGDSQFCFWRLRPRSPRASVVGLRRR